MKTKSLSVGFGLMLTLLLGITFLFAGCSPQNNTEALSFNKQLELAAENYFNGRNSYTNFADTTYSQESNNVFKTKQTLTFTPTGGEEQTLEYEEENASKTQTKLYVKKIGEELALKLEVKQTRTEKSKYFDEDAQQVKSVTDTTVTESTYRMASKTVDEVTSYYILETVKETVNKEDPTTTKKYYQFADKTAYQKAITKYLLKSDNDDEPISENVASLFNSLNSIGTSGSFEGVITETKQDKNSSSCSINLDTFSVDDNEVVKINAKFDVSIKNNKLEKVGSVSTQSNGYSTTSINTVYSISDGTNTEIVISLEGADEVTTDSISANMTDNFPKINLSIG
ncbi:MAG: hypothetical protein IJ837_02945 [Clostridia bacterium]|nr:hypothetical protein [Clostridia bacterium]